MTFRIPYLSSLALTVCRVLLRRAQPTNLTAGKASAGLKCPALGIALQGRSELLKIVWRTVVRMTVSQETMFSERRLKQSLWALKETLLVRRIYMHNSPSSRLLV